MSRALVVVAMVAILVGGAAPAAQIRTIGYERFMSLPESQQRTAFHEADPGTKAMLKRVHAQRWLDRHRTSLNPRQIKAVEQGIAFLTPALYEAAPEQTLKSEVEMTQSLVCAIGRQNVRAAFTFFPPEPQSFGSKIEDWFYWLRACVAR